MLLDTHVWLWWLSDPERLGAQARQVIQNPDNAILLSAVSSWEIAIKCALGKLQLPEPPESFVPKRLARDDIRPLPIQHTHALRVSSLPLHHSDPFDRLLIAQAQIEDIPIITADPLFKSYDVGILWACV